MEFSELAKSRRSVRDYDPSKKVSDEQLKEIFSSARWTPSSYNLQPWEFVIVRDKENKERLKACAYGQTHVGTASAVIIVLGNKDPLKTAKRITKSREHSGNQENLSNFKKSVEGFPEGKTFGERWTVKSTALIAMPIMLAAQNLGLATCPMEGFDSSLVRKEFKIPGNYEVVMLISLGYGTATNERPLKYDYEEMVHLESFSEK